MYILYCNTEKLPQDKAKIYADDIAQKIADKFTILVVGIPVINQPTHLERIDE